MLHALERQSGRRIASMTKVPSSSSITCTLLRALTDDERADDGGRGRIDPARQKCGDVGEAHQRTSAARRPADRRCRRATSGCDTGRRRCRARRSRLRSSCAVRCRTPCGRSPAAPCCLASVARACGGAEHRQQALGHSAAPRSALHKDGIEPFRRPFRAVRRAPAAPRRKFDLRLPAVDRQERQRALDHNLRDAEHQRQVRRCAETGAPRGAYEHAGGAIVARPRCRARSPRRASASR